MQGAGDLVESVFVRSVSGEATRVRLGPALSDKILQRQRDYTQSVEVFADSLKVTSDNVGSWLVLLTSFFSMRTCVISMEIR